MKTSWLRVTTIGLIAIAGAVLAGIAAAEPLTPDQQCLIGRTRTWEKYLKCSSKALILHYTLGLGFEPLEEMKACAAKLDKAWTKLSQLGTVECQAVWVHRPRAAPT